MMLTTCCRWAVFLLLCLCSASLFAKDKSFVEASFKQATLLGKQQPVYGFSMHDNFWGKRAQTLSFSVFSQGVEKHNGSDYEKINKLVYAGPRFQMQRKINHYLHASIYVVAGVGVVDYQRQKNSDYTEVNDMLLALEPGARVFAQAAASWTLIAGISAMSASAGDVVEINMAPVYEMAVQYSW